MLQPSISRVFPMSPEYLRVFKGLPVLEGDRGNHLNERHITSLQRNIQKVALTFEWSIAETPSGVYRINGSHSSSLLFNWMNEGKDVTCFQVHEQVWKCASVDEALVILAQFDNKVSVRSSDQILSAIWASSPDVKANYNDLAAWKMACAASVLNRDGDYGKVSDLEKTEMVMEDSLWKVVLDWFISLPWKDRNLRKHFGRVVLAMAYRTRVEAADHQQWIDFWNGVYSFQTSQDVRHWLGKNIWSGGFVPKNGTERRHDMKRIYTAWKNWLSNNNVKNLGSNFSPWDKPSQ